MNTERLVDLRATLSMARESRGFTQAQLATASKVPQSIISKYETGTRLALNEHVNQLASALDYSVDFFDTEPRAYGFSGGHLYHRRKAIMSSTELNKWQARANIFRIQLEHLLRSVDIEPAFSFPQWSLDEDLNSPEHAAQKLRTVWNMPSGPILNLTQLIEDAGGIICMLQLSTGKIEAMSHVTPTAPPIFFANRMSPPDRYRFSMSHEIAHIVMHQNSTEYAESEADRFAAEFLMPKTDILPHLRKPLSLAYLAELKSYWRVSMQSLVRRAYDLGVIPKTTYHYWFRRLTNEYGRVVEPVQLPIEEPELLNEIISVHYQYGYTDSDMAKMLYISVEEFKRMFAMPTKGMTLVRGRGPAPQAQASGHLRLI